MKDVAVLSHTSDIDGVGAAALVRMKYRMPLGNIFFTGYSAEEVKQAEKRLSMLYKRGVLLFITDLVPEARSVPVYEVIVKGVTSHGGAVVFLDHHPWGKEAIKKIVPKCVFSVFGENNAMCATELVRKYLGLNGVFARKFANIVHHSDFYIQLSEKTQSRLVEQYAMHIAGVNMGKSYAAKLRKLRHIAAVIDSKRLIDSEMRQGAKSFEKLNRERIEKMLRDTYVISGKMAVAFSKQVDSTEACMSLIKKERTDIGIVVNLDHSKASIRSVKGNIARLANALGGGGHPHASAFNIDMRLYNSFRTKPDKEKFVKKIRETAGGAGLL